MNLYVHVAEQADALHSECSANRRVGSNPTVDTIESRMGGNEQIVLTISRIETRERIRNRTCE